jgi:hypothetical protein
MSSNSSGPKSSALWMVVLSLAFCAAPVHAQSTGAQNLKSGNEIFEAG